MAVYLGGTADVATEAKNRSLSGMHLEIIFYPVVAGKGEVKMPGEGTLVRNTGYQWLEQC